MIEQLAIHKQLAATGTISPFVFHRDGERIVYFRAAGKNACKAARGESGLYDTLLHADLLSAALLSRGKLQSRCGEDPAGDAGRIDPAA
jgi:hypothetical protein